MSVQSSLSGTTSAPCYCFLNWWEKVRTALNCFLTSSAPTAFVSVWQLCYRLSHCGDCEVFTLIWSFSCRHWEIQSSSALEPSGISRFSSSGCSHWELALMAWLCCLSFIKLQWKCRKIKSRRKRRNAHPQGGNGAQEGTAAPSKHRRFYFSFFSWQNVHFET